MPVCTHDIFTSCLHHSALSHPIPHIHVLVPPDLPEVEEEANQNKLHEKVSDLMAARVLVLDNFEAEVS